MAISWNFRHLLRPEPGPSISRILRSRNVTQTWRYHKRHHSSGYDSVSLAGRSGRCEAPGGRRLRAVVIDSWMAVARPGLAAPRMNARPTVGCSIIFLPRTAALVSMASVTVYPSKGHDRYRLPVSGSCEPPEESR
jgi:hypothetical protein